MSKVFFNGKTYIEQTPDVKNKLDSYDGLKNFRDKLSTLSVSVDDRGNGSQQTYTVSVDDNGNCQITKTGTINEYIDLEINATGS